MIRSAAIPWAGLLVLVSVVVFPFFSAAQDYVIGPEDVLQITVHDNSDLNRTVAVSLEGSISLPLVGKVKAAGLTSRGLELKITELFADGYLKDPQVSVFIEQYRSQRVFVLGAVKQAGAYVLTKATTLIEILSRAQGITEEAGLDVIVMRPSPSRKDLGPLKPEEAKGEEQITVDLKALVDGDPSQNLILRNGDTVYVSYALDKKVYVLGQVRRPGKYPLSRGSTIVDVISKAEGITEEAGFEAMVVRPSPNNRREGPLRPEEVGKEELILIDLKALMDGDLTRNISLKDGDTVFVPHRLDKKVYVLGQVNRPGKYPLGRSSTVIDMLSKAGGVSTEAGMELLLVRPQPNRDTKGPLTPDQAREDEISTLDLQALQDGDLRHNLLVQDEDTIFVPHSLMRKVYVVGAVKRPGTFSLRRNSTVIEMLSKAEGLSEEAGDDALVIRPQADPSKKGPLTPEQAKAGEITPVDLKAIQEGDLTRNILLKDGDTVFIPKAEVFFVVGEVKKPGRYKLERGTTVLKAVSTAGGVTERSSLKRAKIKVLREVGGIKQEVRADLNSQVMPQDTIIVPETLF